MCRLQIFRGIQGDTTSENLKDPPRKFMVEWVLESWASLSPEVAKKSFQVCRFNVAADGSEDHFVHYFKESQVSETRLYMRHELSLNVNPFTDSDVEDGTEDLALLDERDDEDITDC